nr:hypothetical protein [Tanacetum cinerariifolium]
SHPKYDDDLQFDIESNLKEIEFLLHQDIDSSLKDLIDQSNLANFADNFDSMPEMFTDEHALDYSSPPIFDKYDDYLFKVESDTENVYDDPFSSKGEKIKESKLLIDELDLPCDLLPSFEFAASCRLITDVAVFQRKPTVTNTIKRDKIQAKPSKKQKAWKSQRSKVNKKSTQQNQSQGNQKVKGKQVEGLNLPICKVYKEGGVK